ncbi:MOSC domain-containing protein [Streptomyces mirabilis]|uniref:MOSC domain-containing protein n=1 Tax=Streptomyces mirabilis TaxID=68239 RepID=UPI00331D019F
MTSDEAGRLGTVGRLIRYPVKPMLDTVDVTKRGLAHDRRFTLTLRDPGKVASAAAVLRKVRSSTTYPSICSRPQRSSGSRPPTGTAEVERYRPTIAIRISLAAGFAENDWTGRALRIGADLTLRVIARTPRCAVPTLAHGALPRDAAALRVLAGHNRVIPLESMEPQPCAGVYAQVLSPGPIQLGDPVRWV